jgi:hypothetical protein
MAETRPNAEKMAARDASTPVEEAARIAADASRGTAQAVEMGADRTTETVRKAAEAGHTVLDESA